MRPNSSHRRAFPGRQILRPGLRAHRRRLPQLLPAQNRGLFPFGSLHRDLLLLELLPSRGHGRLLLSGHDNGLLLHQLPLTSHGCRLLQLLHLLSDQRRDEC